MVFAAVLNKTDRPLNNTVEICLVFTGHRKDGFPFSYSTNEEIQLAGCFVYFPDVCQAV